MLIAAQSVLILIAILFAMGAIADDDIKNRQIYGMILCTSIVALVVTFVI